MTNTQVLLAISIVPSPMVLSGILLDRRGFKKLERHLDRLDETIDRLQADFSHFHLG